MEIKLSKTAYKSLEKMPQRISDKIKEAIKGLSEEPPKGDIKPMQGYPKGVMRLRVGQYRVVYKYVNEETVFIYVIDIGSRGDIYKHI